MAYNANTKARSETNRIVVEYTGTNDDLSAADLNRSARKLGFACIGYHFVIRQDGTLEEGRAEATVGAASIKNDELGICIVGKGSKTDEQRETLDRLVAYLRPKYPEARLTERV